MTREKLLIEIQQKYPKVWAKESEVFKADYKDCIWTGEGSYIGVLPAFNYYATSPLYIMGVLEEFHNFLERRGWYCEWYDAGTIIINKI